MFNIKRIHIDLKQKKSGHFLSNSKHIIKLSGFFGAISYPGNVIVIDGEALLNLPKNVLINFSIKHVLTESFSLHLVRCHIDYDDYIYEKMLPYIESLFQIKKENLTYTRFLSNLINRDAQRNFKSNNTGKKTSLSKYIYILISKNIQHSWTVEEVCKQVYLSRAALTRKLSREKTTLSDIILSARMDKAACFLLQKKYTVKQVAYLTGFSSSSYFCKKFKHTYGRSPREFVNTMSYHKTKEIFRRRLL
ncbi:helix-turn-helix transcriptional regulator [Vibrio sp. SNU_ST1]|uniref:helix-turn-helix transcriptional regulator n=1 Tax=Vibrio sp. SNU_ST1 TaxID=3064001 RepID=UPI00272D1C73|nr:response regulator transcription factor [Vibrio sp. SNU_ST1]WKY60425.1 helix-turn-helix transcriptional regulator [Vibrio sp. SNU_ST1]